MHPPLFVTYSCHLLPNTSPQNLAQSGPLGSVSVPGGWGAALPVHVARGPVGLPCSCRRGCAARSSGGCSPHVGFPWGCSRGRAPWPPTSPGPGDGGKPQCRPGHRLAATACRLHLMPLGPRRCVPPTLRAYLKPPLALRGLRASPCPLVTGERAVLPTPGVLRLRLGHGVGGDGHRVTSTALRGPALVQEGGARGQGSAPGAAGVGGWLPESWTGREGERGGGRGGRGLGMSGSPGLAVSPAFPALGEFPLGRVRPGAARDVSVRTRRLPALRLLIRAPGDPGDPGTC